MSANNIDIVHRFYKAMEEKNYKAFDELQSPNMKIYVGILPGPGGRDEHMQLIQAFTNAFPDLHFDIEDTIADANKVALRGVFIGTNNGEFQGMPPTGKKVRMPFIDIYEISNNKIQNEWVEMDVMGLMQQLGAIPNK